MSITTCSLKTCTANLFLIFLLRFDICKKKKIKNLHLFKCLHEIYHLKKDLTDGCFILHEVNMNKPPTGVKMIGY